MLSYLSESVAAGYQNIQSCIYTEFTLFVNPEFSNSVESEAETETSLVCGEKVLTG